MASRETSTNRMQKVVENDMRSIDRGHGNAKNIARSLGKRAARALEGSMRKIVPVYGRLRESITPRL